jgi:hypothetical protein
MYCGELRVLRKSRCVVNRLNSRNLSFGGEIVHSEKRKGHRRVKKTGLTEIGGRQNMAGRRVQQRALMLEVLTLGYCNHTFHFS